MRSPGHAGDQLMCAAVFCNRLSMGAYRGMTPTIGFYSYRQHGHRLDLATTTAGYLASAAHRSASVNRASSGSEQMGDGKAVPSIEVNLIAVI